MQLRKTLLRKIKDLRNNTNTPNNNASWSSRAAAGSAGATVVAGDGRNVSRGAPTPTTQQPESVQDDEFVFVDYIDCGSITAEDEGGWWIVEDDHQSPTADSLHVPASTTPSCTSATTNEVEEPLVFVDQHYEQDLDTQRSNKVTNNGAENVDLNYLLVEDVVVETRTHTTEPVKNKVVWTGNLHELHHQHTFCKDETKYSSHSGDEEDDKKREYRTNCDIEKEDHKKSSENDKEVEENDDDDREDEELSYLQHLQFDQALIGTSHRRKPVVAAEESRQLKKSAAIKNSIFDSQHPKSRWPYARSRDICRDPVTSNTSARNARNNTSKERRKAKKMLTRQLRTERTDAGLW
ncbi:hypothetical protein Pcinc_018047 [Petrolisthes cinctipes]|uniref:Uncharacterized protein n=1 Tax=Petrolisthes cinctipes TaxID=88211 RepID=A0AAE1FNV9_PETCI|nr:hypothetical protein Pcinc_018047 [Petrolisthes cinctipes]